MTPIPTNCFPSTLPVGSQDENFKSVFAFPVANAVDRREVGRIRLVEDAIVDVPSLAVDQSPHELLASQHTFLPIGAAPIEIERLGMVQTWVTVSPVACDRKTGRVSLLPVAGDGANTNYHLSPENESI